MKPDRSGIRSLRNKTGIICAVLAATALASCAWIFPKKVDVVLYNDYVEFTAAAQKLEAACGNPQKESDAREALRDRMAVILVHVAHAGDEADQGFAQTVAKMLKSADRSGASITFCRESARNLAAGSGRVLDTIGRREW